LVLSISDQRGAGPKEEISGDCSSALSPRYCIIGNSPEAVGQHERALCVDSGRLLAVQRVSANGASRPLPSVPTKVRLLNRLPTLDLGGGDYSSCPNPAGAGGENDRLSRVETSHPVFRIILPSLHVGFCYSLDGVDAFRAANRIVR
jgi:hypothetical protein